MRMGRGLEAVTQTGVRREAPPPPPPRRHSLRETQWGGARRAGAEAGLAVQRALFSLPVAKQGPWAVFRQGLGRDGQRAICARRATSHPGANLLLPAEVKRAHGTPPPVSPKPPPPPTAPKPAKAAAGLQSGSSSPSPAPSPARQQPAALAKPASTPPALSASPASPARPPSPGAPALHVPAKPPRAAAAATGPPAAPDGASPGDSARQKLEETSACLAAALQAVEEKIRQEDAQGSR